MYTRAIEYLEELLQTLGPQSDILAQLISCSYKVDIKLVKEYSENLVSIEQLNGECDVEELSKTSDMFLSNKYALKKAGKAATNQEAANELAKKKKKKKPRLPKTFDPNVQPDPERWLPKWERSAFKKSRQKKDKHDVDKGTQGGTSGGSVYDHTGPKTQAAQAASSAPDSPKVTSGARPKTAQLKRRRVKKR
ncbi:signal recognition particle subunit SRP72-like [Symsagittifera roscoffensis]|uniref:signal recognition particle subunit SRP72-like n=1 Tax=Symsagittifera roscoffensis TaxID=84072 RepID=UPI00307B584B